MAALAPNFHNQFFHAGVVAAGYSLYTRVTGTATAKAAYTDQAGTIPHTNPIILDAQGMIPGQLWLGTGEYRLRLETPVGALVDEWDDVDGAAPAGEAATLRADLATADAAKGSRIVGHLPSVTGSVATTVGAMLDRMFSVSILTFGAVAGVSDNTAAFELAAATGRVIYIPSGTWYCNAVFTESQRIVMIGDGSRNSIIKPYDLALPGITHGAGGSFDYHSEYRNLGFAGTGKTGVGITFGSKTGSAVHYVTNAELAGNTKFYGCNFTDCDKGVQFPNGNIGSEFYSCGFGGNKYGVYAINNKTGSGSGMHAGNKYFFGGEFHSNECGVFIDNAMDGFGGVVFRSTIFESNWIDLYLNNQTNIVIQPIIFDDVWFEDTIAGAAVTIDSWSGATRTTQSVARGRMIIDGTNAHINFNGGNFSDCALRATYSQVRVTGARCERVSGVGGVNSVVTSSTSNIHQIDCYGDLGPSVGYNIFSSGLSYVHRAVMETSAATDGTRWMTVRPRTSKTTGYGVSLAAGVTFTSIEAGTGSFAASGVVTAGGEIYATYNNFSRNNTSGAVEYFKITNSNVASTTANYWYVVTFDAIVNSGSVATEFYVWDRSSVALAYGMSCPTQNRWYSFAALAQSTGGSNIYLDCALPVGSNDWGLSAFQIHKFPTLYEAQNFLASGVYCPS